MPRAETLPDTNIDDIPLDQIDVSDPSLYQTDSFYSYLKRLRREDPVHYCADSLYGPYWSVTRYDDIMKVELGHTTYSSAAHLDGIAL